MKRRTRNIKSIPPDKEKYPEEEDSEFAVRKDNEGGGDNLPGLRSGVIPSQWWECYRVEALELAKSAQNLMRNLQPENADITIPLRGPTDKASFCLYCQKSFSKLVRHWQAKHKSEPEMQYLEQLESGEKKQFTDLLTRKGSHLKNIDVLTKGKGELQLVRAPNRVAHFSVFFPCTQCLGWYNGRDIPRHRCPSAVCPATIRQLKEDPFYKNCWNPAIGAMVQAKSSLEANDKSELDNHDDSLMDITSQFNHETDDVMDNDNADIDFQFGDGADVDVKIESEEPEDKEEANLCEEDWTPSVGVKEDIDPEHYDPAADKKLDLLMGSQLCGLQEPLVASLVAAANDLLAKLKVGIKCDTGDITVPLRGPGEKASFCVFCSKPYIKLVRHWTSVHKKEPEIDYLEGLKGEERKHYCDLLTRKGNHLINLKVLMEGEGELQLIRAPNSPTHFFHFFPCSDCLGWYRKRDLPRHRCPRLAFQPGAHRTKNEPKQNKRQRNQETALSDLEEWESQEGSEAKRRRFGKRRSMVKKVESMSEDDDNEEDDPTFLAEDADMIYTTGQIKNKGDILKTKMDVNDDFRLNEVMDDETLFKQEVDEPQHNVEMEDIGNLGGSFDDSSSDDSELDEDHDDPRDDDVLARLDQVWQQQEQAGQEASSEDEQMASSDEGEHNEDSLRDLVESIISINEASAAEHAITSTGEAVNSTDTTAEIRVEKPSENLEQSTEKPKDSHDSAKDLHQSNDINPISEDGKMNIEGSKMNESKNAGNDGLGSEDMAAKEKTMNNPKIDPGCKNDNEGSKDTFEASKTKKIGRPSACLFCGQVLPHMKRHWVKQHRADENLREYFSLKDAKRRRHFEKTLINLGNHRHNLLAIQEGSDKLLVKDSPLAVIESHQYRPCHSCYRWLHPRDAGHHCCSPPEEVNPKLLPSAAQLAEVEALQTLRSAEAEAEAADEASSAIPSLWWNRYVAAIAPEVEAALQLVTASESQPQSTNITISLKPARERPTFCPFCLEESQLFTSHLLQAHRKVPDVQYLNHLPMAERRLLRDVLVRRGHHAHNTRVFEQGHGELIVAMTPRTAGTSTNWKDYLPCGQCLGWFTAKQAPRHKCPVVPSSPVNVSKLTRKESFFCAFCGEEKSRIRRHWKLFHGDEAEVQDILTQPNEEVRQRLIYTLINRGNHEHNIRVLKQGDGKLVSRDGFRPVSDYFCLVVCVLCLAWCKKVTYGQPHVCPLASGGRREKPEMETPSMFFLYTCSTSSMEDAWCRKIERRVDGGDLELTLKKRQSNMGVRELTEDDKQVCIFCGEQVKDLWSHIRLHPELIKLRQRPRWSRQNSQLLKDYLLNAGFHYRNLQIIFQGRGDLLVKSVTKSYLPYAVYRPCSGCLAWTTSMPKVKHICPNSIRGAQHLAAKQETLEVINTHLDFVTKNKFDLQKLARRRRKHKRFTIDPPGGHEDADGDGDDDFQPRLASSDYRSEAIVTDPRETYANHITKREPDGMAGGTNAIPDKYADDVGRDDLEVDEGPEDAAYSSEDEDLEGELKKEFDIGNEKPSASITIQRIFNNNKYNYCTFCLAPQSKIRRHWKCVHMSEPEMKKLSTMTGEEKTFFSNYLVNKGNHIHNMLVLRRGRGELVLKKNSRIGDKEYTMYVPCCHCYSWHVVNELRRHKCLRGHKAKKILSRYLPIIIRRCYPDKNKLTTIMKDKPTLSKLLEKEYRLLDWAERHLSRLSDVERAEALEPTRKKPVKPDPEPDLDLIDDDEEDMPIRPAMKVEKSSNSVPASTLVLVKEEKPRPKIVVQSNLKQKLDPLTGRIKTENVKYNYCPFCGTSFSKLVRHLMTMHQDEEDVQKLKVAEGEQRRKMLISLRRLGNHNHNMTVLREGKGEVVLVSRTRESGPGSGKVSGGSKVVHPGDSKSHLPCHQCLGWFTEERLLSHRCKGEDPERTKKKRLALSLKMLRGDALEADDEGPPLDKVDAMKEAMRKDEIHAVVSTDPLIQEFMKKQMESGVREGKRKYSTIRSDARILGRFVYEYRKMYKTKVRLSRLLTAKKLDRLVAVAGRMGKAGTMTPFKVGTLLEKVVTFLIEKGKAVSDKEGACAASVGTSESFEGTDVGPKPATSGAAPVTDVDPSQQEESLTDIVKLRDMLRNDWKNRMSEAATKRKRGGSKPFPDRKSPKLLTDQDVQTLARHLETHLTICINRYKDELDKNKKMREYRLLQDALLSRIVQFNRCRCTDVSEMTVKEFEQAKDIYRSLNLDMDVYPRLNEEEVKWAKSHFLIVRNEEVVMETQQRDYFLILSAQMLEAMELLVKDRLDLKIPPANPYVFAIPLMKDSHIRGHSALGKTAAGSGLQQVTSKNIRHHLISVMQNENEASSYLDLPDLISRHIGQHAASFYAVRENMCKLIAIETGQMSRVLTEVDEGILRCGPVKASVIPKFKKTSQTRSKPTVRKKEEPALAAKPVIISSIRPQHAAAAKKKAATAVTAYSTGQHLVIAGAGQYHHQAVMEPVGQTIAVAGGGEPVQYRLVTPQHQHHQVNLTGVNLHHHQQQGGGLINTSGAAVVQHPSVADLNAATVVYTSGGIQAAEGISGQAANFINYQVRSGPASGVAGGGQPQQVLIAAAPSGSFRTAVIPKVSSSSGQHHQLHQQPQQHQQQHHHHHQPQQPHHVVVSIGSDLIPTHQHHLPSSTSASIGVHPTTAITANVSTSSALSTASGSNSRLSAVRQFASAANNVYNVNLMAAAAANNMTVLAAPPALFAVNNSMLVSQQAHHHLSHHQSPSQQQQQHQPPAHHHSAVHHSSTASTASGSAAFVGQHSAVLAASSHAAAASTPTVAGAAFERSVLLAEPQQATPNPPQHHAREYLTVGEQQQPQPPGQAQQPKQVGFGQF